ncbi:MAG TPA: DUF2171 domain-containing protein [Sphingomicrobium sp.]
MAYDRYDTRDAPRDERSRWHDERFEARRGERGFFERAGDEVASWFGDEDAERRRREDQLRLEREGRYGRDYNRGYARDYGRDWERDRTQRDWYETRGSNERGGFGERDYNPSWRRELSGPGNRERDWDRERGFGDRGYRPMTGDYGRSEQSYFPSGIGRGERGAADHERSDYGRSETPYGLDEYRRTSRAGTSDWSDRSRHEDPHYRSWRERHIGELDRDYEDYRRENQARFESDFGSWRERRMQKRALLGQIREHMEVVGSDDGQVGTVDRIAGDRIILTKSDPESGGAHHSLSCSDIDRIEGDRVILDVNAEQARRRWRDESRSRALFEREDQGEAGPRVLDRSFEGTYR